MRPLHLPALLLALLLPQERTDPVAAREAELHTFALTWFSAFEERDAPTVARMLASEDFTWFEDGERRYPDAGSVVRALTSMPAGQSFDCTPREVHVRLLADDAGYIDLMMDTTVTVDDREVARFESACSMLLLRDEGGWRIARAHSSSERARPR